MNLDDQFRQFLLYQQLPPSIGDDHSNPLPSWDTEMEPALPVGRVEEDPGESYDPDDPSTFDPVQPPTMMQLLAEEGIPEFDPQWFLDEPAPVAGVDQTFDPTQFIDMSQGETFAEVFAAQPTTRLMLTNAVEALAVEWGMNPNQAASLAGRLLGDVEGSGGGVLGLGVADLTPVGLWNDFQEAMLRAGKTLNPTSVMDSIDAGSAAMNLGIAAVQAIPVPFVALKFLQKAQTYIDDVARGVIVPGALAVRSVDDAGKTVPTSEVLGATAARADTLKQATDLSPAGFYSAVRRAVDALPQEKGSAQQMRAMIAKGEGVKAEEMAWIGLDDFLKGRKNVTKQEIADFVDANQVEVVPITKDLDQAAAREESIFLQEQHMAGEITDAELLAKEKAISARQTQYGPFGLDGFGGDARLSLKGGENYREVLLTLPVQHGITELPPNYVVEKVTEGMGNLPMYGVREPGSQYIGFKDNRDDAIADALRVINEVQNKTKNTEAFRAGHMDEPNVLAHIRMNDRTGPDGERILFVEEIQSDWHQLGRQKGYKKDTSNLDRELDFVESQLDELAPKSKANKDHIDAGGDRSQLPFPNIGRDIENFTDRRAELVSDMAKFKDGVPDAPLKKTWHEMSLRRVIRMAAEEGYDSVAWTPGRIQAERYDLSKQVKELLAQKHGDGTYSFGYKPSEGGNMRKLKTFVPDEEMDALVGKEMAEKIRKQTDETVIYSGLDLQVGGGFLKTLYDKKLKNFATKFGKKFGAKVGTTKVNTTAPGGPGPFALPDDVRVFHDLSEELWSDLSLSERQQLRREAEEAGVGLTEVWTIPITPKMRESVLKKGVAMFSAGAGVAVAAEGSANGS